MYYVYVLLSDKDNRFYTGFTDNLKRRVAEHNSGKVQSTALRRPLRLVYFSSGYENEKTGPMIGIFVYEINKDYLNHQ